MGEPAPPRPRRARWWLLVVGVLAVGLLAAIWADPRQLVLFKLLASLPVLLVGGVAAAVVGWRIMPARVRWALAGGGLVACAAAVGVLAVVFSQPSPVTEPTAPVPQVSGPEWFCDLTPTPLPRITPGTVVGPRPPEGWTHIMVKLRLKYEPDPKIQIPGPVADASGALACVAVVRSKAVTGADGLPVDVLEQVAQGMSMAVPDGDQVVASARPADCKRLGWLATTALKSAEADMQHQWIVARTPSLWVFDIRSRILRDGRILPITRRYAVQLSGHHGTMAILYWDRPQDADGGSPAPVEATRVATGLDDVLPMGVCDRQTLTADLFACKRGPAGTPFPLPDWARDLNRTPPTADTVRRLEAEIAARAGLTLPAAK